MSETADEPRLRALLRLGREVTARHDLDDVLTEAFRELRTVVEFSGGSIQLIDDDGWITVAACDPAVADDAMQTRVPLGNSVAGRVVLTEQAIYVPDVGADGRDVLLPTTEWTERVQAYLAVPLLADGRAIGLLRLDKTEPGGFSASDRQLLVAAGVIIAAAIQNARAQARSAAARTRVDALERRLEQLRVLLGEARATSSRSDQDVEALLQGLEREVGAAGAPADGAAASRITL